MDDGCVGVYVHVPFCERVCPYCDFAVEPAPRLPPAREQAFVAGVLAELALRAPAFDAPARPLVSLYFGGGTPSRLAPASIARIAAAVRAAFPGAGDPEVTLEMNPGTTERARLPGFREAGANRLSVGVQSFDDRVLKRLGRAHRAADARAALAAARAAGFGNVSLDLIVAAPGQRLDDVSLDLAEAVAVGPQHVSVYTLTIEEGTPFALAARRGQLALAGEDEGAAMLERVAERLEAAGLARYEISSFARAGHASRHNRRYWARCAVLGLGPGAWSCEPPAPGAPFGARRRNLRGLDAWLARLRSGACPEAEPPERLGEATARAEAVFLGLRTADGVAAGAFAAEFGAPPRTFFGEAIDELAAAGLLREAPGGDLALTARGLLLADSVCERFV
jgi:oxygen-independent coproporphyrinogen-3 oxidase